MTKYRKYKKAFKIACKLLNGGYLFGYDTSTIFENILKEYGSVTNTLYEKYILDNIKELDGSAVRWRADIGGRR